MEDTELQLGRVHSINTDGSINIIDFKTGGLVYNNVSIEHPGSFQQQPIVGQHVLFVTFPTMRGSSRFVKVIRFYSSTQGDDTKLVRASPLDMADGELKLVSKSGNTIYLTNGAIQISSLGQYILQVDDPNITKIRAGTFQIVTTDGTLIEEKNGTLSIKKGIPTPSSDGVTSKMDVPVISIEITPTKISINGIMATVETNCREVKLNGSTPVARQNDTIKIDATTEDMSQPNILRVLSALQMFMTEVQGVISPATASLVGAAAIKFLAQITTSPTTLTGKITTGSSKVKAG